MSGLSGEYEVKLDDKSRFILPSNLKKQLPLAAESTFILKNGSEKCIVLHPKNEWELKCEKVKALSSASSKISTYKRLWFSGTYVSDMDSNGRVLIPKKYLEYANISKDMKIIAQEDIIEIWDPATYNELYSNPEATFQAISDELYEAGLI